MKIVHIVGFFTPELGYQEYYLAKAHSKMGHEVHVITSDLPYPFPNSKNLLRGRKRMWMEAGHRIIDRFHVHRLKHSIIRYSDFIIIKGVKDLLKKIKPDIVFSHESRQVTPSIPALYKKNLGFKYVVDHHDIYHKIPNYPLYKKILRYLDYKLIRNPIVRFNLAQTDHIIAVADESKRFLMDKMGIKENRITLVPLGVDTEAYYFDQKTRNQERKALRFTSDKIVLIFVGTIVRRKRLEALIKVLSQIHDERIKLLLVGSGDIKYIKYLKNLVRDLKINDKVVFTGFKNKEEVRRLYCASDIGIWPGNNTVSIMEAMSCKLPIIMVNLQLSHLVSFNNGYLFNEGDNEKLKKLIVKLTSNKRLRIKLGNNSYKAIKENLTYDSIARKFLDIAKKY